MYENTIWMMKPKFYKLFASYSILWEIVHDKSTAISIPNSYFSILPNKGHFLDILCNKSD